MYIIYFPARERASCRNAAATVTRVQESQPRWVIATPCRHPPATRNTIIFIKFSLRRERETGVIHTTRWNERNVCFQGSGNDKLSRRKRGRGWRGEQKKRNARGGEGMKWDNPGERGIQTLRKTSTFLNETHLHQNFDTAVLSVS